MIKFFNSVFIFLGIACIENGTTKKELTQNPTYAVTIPLENFKTNDTCDEVITKLVKSSNAAAIKNFPNCNLRIDKIDNQKITIKLFITNDISEDPSVKKNIENPVGWLEFYPSSKKLIDITNDIENPIILRYDNAILDQVDLINLCDFTNNNLAFHKNDVKCSRIKNGEYSFKEICEYDGDVTFEFIHSQIKEKFDQDDLLKKLPEKDTTYSTEATPKITYLLKKNIVKIEVLSEGGQTDIKIFSEKGKKIIKVQKNLD